MTPETAGARCALHPERPAQGTCKRCGNFACSDCNVEGFSTGVLCTTCAKTTAVSRYHVVPVWRFVLLNVLSFNIYAVYWFWKNWSSVKRADGSNIWPTVRALFAGVTYFSLITDLNTHLALRQSTRRISAMMGLGFLVTGALSRLPAPHTLVSVLAFLFVLPAVAAVRELASDAALAAGDSWRLRHTVAMVLLLPFFVLALLGTLVPEEALQ